jgi:hypothetical protein
MESSPKFGIAPKRSYSCHLGSQPLLKFGLSIVPSFLLNEMNASKLKCYPFPRNGFR